MAGIWRMLWHDDCARARSVRIWVMRKFDNPNARPTEIESAPMRCRNSPDMFLCWTKLASRCQVFDVIFLHCSGVIYPTALHYRVALLGLKKEAKRPFLIFCIVTCCVGTVRKFAGWRRGARHSYVLVFLTVSFLPLQGRLTTGSGWRSSAVPQFLRHGSLKYYAN